MSTTSFGLTGLWHEDINSDRVPLRRVKLAVKKPKKAAPAARASTSASASPPATPQPAAPGQHPPLGPPGRPSKAAELLQRAYEADRAALASPLPAAAGSAPAAAAAGPPGKPQALATAASPAAAPQIGAGGDASRRSGKSPGDRMNVDSEVQPAGAASQSGAPPAAAKAGRFERPTVDNGFLDVVVPAPKPDAPAAPTWASFPRTMGLANSFRASMRGGLLAVPVVTTTGEFGGPCTYRIRLLQVKPGLPRGTRAEEATRKDEDELAVKSRARSRSCSRERRTGSLVRTAPAVSSGVDMLQAQLRAGFAVPTPDASLDAGGTCGVPRALVPRDGAAAVALLDSYCASASSCLGAGAEEAFELLRAFLGNGSAAGDAESSGASRGPEPRKWPPEDLREVRQVARRLSVWLSKANGKTVAQHLDAAADAAKTRARIVDIGSDRSAATAGAPEDALAAVFHHLTANSVKRALQSLRSAARDARDGTRPHYDRLAAIIASCGGASTPSAERRQWLRRQLAEWRAQGVRELMGPNLWRIYNLLAGELDEVVNDALDWRTAFGTYLWYRFPEENADAPMETEKELQEAVTSFEQAVGMSGDSCLFQPVPAYYAEKARRRRSSANRPIAQPDPKARAAPIDLQFSAIRAAVGLEDWRDVSHFDYATYTSKPMDLARSWHFSVLLLALFGCQAEEGGAASSLADCRFQQLTQQYCLELELLGEWQWAIYVALFVREPRSRTAIVRGLLQRHAAIPARSLRNEEKPQWPGVPDGWLRRAMAFRCEVAKDWPTAMACWLRSEETVGSERALAIAAAFLQTPTVLRHSEAPFQGGPMERILLTPMSPPARWLLRALEELEGRMVRTNASWTFLGAELLNFMRSWAQASQATASTNGPLNLECKPAEVTHLYARCESARRLVLGLPW